MIVPLALLVVLLCVALAGWATWFVVRDRAVVLRQLWGGAVIETVLVVQAVVAGVLAATDPPAGLSGGLFWGYVVTQAIVLPFAAAWAFAERTRWSSVVLLVAALTVAFLEYRLLQIWGTV